MGFKIKSLVIAASLTMATPSYGFSLLDLLTGGLSTFLAGNLISRFAPHKGHDQYSAYSADRSLQHPAVPSGGRLVESPFAAAMAPAAAIMGSHREPQAAQGSSMRDVIRLSQEAAARLDEQMSRFNKNQREIFSAGAQSLQSLQKAHQATFDRRKSMADKRSDAILKYIESQGGILCEGGVSGYIDRTGKDQGRVTSC